MSHSKASILAEARGHDSEYRGRGTVLLPGPRRPDAISEVEPGPKLAAQWEVRQDDCTIQVLIIVLLSPPLTGCQCLIRYIVNQDQSLQVHYVTAQDAGRYTCTAVNDVGESSASAFLAVQREFAHAKPHLSGDAGFC